jgi:hypothetical protein
VSCLVPDHTPELALKGVHGEALQVHRGLDKAGTRQQQTETDRQHLLLMH